jgi:hypothetical protein
MDQHIFEIRKAIKFDFKFDDTKFKLDTTYFDDTVDSYFKVYFL